MLKSKRRKRSEVTAEAARWSGLAEGHIERYLRRRANLSRLICKSAVSSLMKKILRLELHFASKPNHNA